MGQNLTANQNQPHMMLVTFFPSEIQLQIIVDAKMVSKMSQGQACSSLDNQPELATCARFIILGHNTLATSSCFVQGKAFIVELKENR